MEILAHEVMINCIYLSSEIPPFVTNELLSEANRKLSVICDVSWWA